MDAKNICKNSQFENFFRDSNMFEQQTMKFVIYVESYHALCVFMVVESPFLTLK